tara:strand:+ start:188 stop:400 length:213 start_codon:yes stop_codon:yes gene_type:complete
LEISRGFFELLVVHLTCQSLKLAGGFLSLISQCSLTLPTTLRPLLRLHCTSALSFGFLLLTPGELLKLFQ